jgi:prepilin-type N-terminal cleavage/methylation domain-containing protein
MSNIDIYMKEFIESLKKLLKRKKGFTLIELLVVIGILGVLAAMLVATIDPFEQIKKANDSKVQNTAVEFTSANIRYYTSQNGFPWDNTNVDGTACAAAFSPAYVPGTSTTIAPQSLDKLDSGSPAHGCLTELITTGELKSSFTSIVGVLNNVWVSMPDVVNRHLLVCYLPLSKAGQKDINANWKLTGGTILAPTGWAQDDAVTKYCPSMGGPTTHVCFWCTQ